MANEFGQMLRKLREGAKVSLGQLARTLGVTTPYLSDVELGRRGPLTKERIDQAAGVLKLDNGMRRELEQAAAESRGYFELDATSSSAVKLQLGAALARKWPALDEGRARKMLEALGDED